MILFQNPFFSIEETILCLLVHPRPVSSPCLDLIRLVMVKFHPLHSIFIRSYDIFGLCRGLLRKDPKKRFPLERVRDHEWTTMSVDPASYNFADVVDCSESQS